MFFKSIVDMKFYSCFVERLSNLLGVVLLLRMETYAAVPTEISFARVILLIHLRLTLACQCCFCH